MEPCIELCRFRGGSALCAILVSWLLPFRWVPGLHGGFKHVFFVYPYLQRWSNLTNIFQMGWFNHQLELADLTAGRFLKRGSDVFKNVFFSVSSWVHSQGTMSWDESHVARFLNHQQYQRDFVPEIYRSWSSRVFCHLSPPPEVLRSLKFRYSWNICKSFSRQKTCSICGEGSRICVY